MAKAKYDLNESLLFSRNNVPEKKVGRPLNEKIVRDNSAQEGLTADFTRATLIVEVDLLETLKDYAYTERLSLKDVVNNIFRDYIENNIDKSSLLHKPSNRR